MQVITSTKPINMSRASVNKSERKWDMLQFIIMNLFNMYYQILSIRLV